MHPCQLQFIDLSAKIDIEAQMIGTDGRLWDVLPTVTLSTCCDAARDGNWKMRAIRSVKTILSGISNPDAQDMPNRLTCIVSALQTFISTNIEHQRISADTVLHRSDFAKPCAGRDSRRTMPLVILGHDAL